MGTFTIYPGSLAAGGPWTGTGPLSPTGAGTIRPVAVDQAICLGVPFVHAPAPGTYTLAGVPDSQNVFLDGSITGTPLQSLPAGFTITSLVVHVTGTFTRTGNANSCVSAFSVSRDGTVLTSVIPSTGALNLALTVSGPFTSPLFALTDSYLLSTTFAANNTAVTGCGNLTYSDADCPITGFYLTGVYSLSGASYLLPSVGSVRSFDAKTDREVALFPSDPTQLNLPSVPVSLFGHAGTLYASAHTSGQAGTAVGSVYRIDPGTGEKLQLGAPFPTGQMPYAFCWAYGQLWVGTVVNLKATTSGAQVYRIRPGVDTVWTLDQTFGTSLNGVTGLAVFNGEIYASLIYSGTGSSSAYVYKRTLGVWSISDTGAVSASTVGLARGYYGLIVWPGSAYQGTPVSALYAVRNGITGDTASVIRKFDGTSWSSVYTGTANFYGLASMPAQTAAGIVVPVLWSANGDTALINSIDGSAWVSRAAALGNARSTMATSGVIRPTVS